MLKLEIIEVKIRKNNKCGRHGGTRTHTPEGNGFYETLSIKKVFGKVRCGYQLRHMPISFKLYSIYVICQPEFFGM